MIKEKISTVQVENKPWAERPIKIATYYKGYEIRAAPYQLADSGKWEVNGCIFRDHGDEVRLKEFSSANSFKALEEAIACCLYACKQIIDRKIKNCNVDRR